MNYFGESLSQFLVTFCLHESVFGSPSLSPVDNVEDLNRTFGKIPIPLWLDAGYPAALDSPRSVSFYLVDGKILQMGGWCGGRVAGIDEELPGYFPRNDTYALTATGSGRAIWDMPEVPKHLKTQGLEQVIHRHEELASSHTDKARFYRELLAKIESEAGATGPRGNSGQIRGDP